MPPMNNDGWEAVEPTREEALYLRAAERSARQRRRESIADWIWLAIYIVPFVLCVLVALRLDGDAYSNRLKATIWFCATAAVVVFELARRAVRDARGRCS